MTPEETVMTILMGITAGSSVASILGQCLVAGVIIAGAVAGVFS